MSWLAAFGGIALFVMFLRTSFWDQGRFGQVQQDVLARTTAIPAMSSVSTRPPINWDSCYASLTAAQAVGKDGCNAKCNWNMEWGAKSNHPGGANFVFADASVQFLSATIDHMNYQLLGDKCDRKPVQIP